VDYRTLGKTGLRVSMMGMGTGGHDPLGAKSGRSEKEMVALLHHAFARGINLFDTSPGYADGRSERLLGQAIRGTGRERVVISTKIPLAGSMPGEPPVLMKPKQVGPAVEASLRRLQTDYIDIMLMAVADVPEHFDAVIRDLVPELQRLKAQGKIRFIGSSEQTRSDGAHIWLRRLLETDVPEVVMVGHNMINQSAQRTVVPHCGRRQIGVLNIFTVRNLFWNPARLRMVVGDLNQRGVLGAEVDEQDPLAWLLKDGEVGSLVEAAYRYAAYTPSVTSVMSGTIKTHELDENIRSIAKGPLTQEKLGRLQRTFGRVAEPIGN
jgi:L-galactose dehydrogenase